MAPSHVLLLPRENYFEWVRATTKYVLAFGISITPDPEKAASKENATVILTESGYPEFGDILVWLRQNAQDLRLDVIQPSSPEELKKILQTRVDSGLPFGMPDSGVDPNDFLKDDTGDLSDVEEVFTSNGEPDLEEIDIPEDGVRTDDLPVEIDQVVDDLGVKAVDPLDEIDGSIEVQPQVILPEKLFRLAWPTDYPKIVQSFAANPEIYSKWGLPGHEGVDIRAPMNTNVYACASGEVFVVNDVPEAHAYGKHIRIRHEGGYRTVYGHLASILVNVGEIVQGGQLIGKADSTGNSTGSHLHLTLKKEGATARGETQFKGDIIDPTPFLDFPTAQTEISSPKPQTYNWAGPTLMGVNIRDDGFLHDADFKVVQEARLEAVKIQENTPTSVIQKLTLTRSDLFIAVRLAYELGRSPVTPHEWVARILPDIDRLYGIGLRFFEIHQSPNLQAFGWNYSWHSGGGFARWWLDITHQLRDRFPESRFGFPGVSPGGQVEGQRLDAGTFLEQAEDAIQVADWLGVNCFWSDGMELQSEEKGAYYKAVRQRFPANLLIVTEFGNVNLLTNPYVKGNEYVQFLQDVRQIPGVAAIFSQVISSAKGYAGMQWRDELGELTQIPFRVGQR